MAELSARRAVRVVQLVAGGDRDGLRFQLAALPAAELAALVEGVAELAVAGLLAQVDDPGEVRTVLAGLAGAGS